MILAGHVVRNAKVVILGLTFKENCPDIRNSKVEDVINRLREFGVEPIVVDPWADAKETMHEYNVSITRLEDVSNADCLIFAVSHDQFKELSWKQVSELYNSQIPMTNRVLIDVKGIWDRKEALQQGYRFWRL